MINKKILIVDEEAFSRICAAILEFEGYGIETITRAADTIPLSDTDRFGLIITSYPYGAFLFDEIKQKDISTIILSDQISGDLLSILEGFDNSYCMIKPLDYHKFRFIVKQVMSGDSNRIQGGYNIV